MTEIEVKKLSDLKPDNQNANRGTERGRAMLESSLRQWGAGRSILLDREGRIIAGNKTFEEAGQIGLEDVVVVRTKGDQLVAVLREDLDLSDDATGARELAYADNRVGQVSLDWEPEQILADMNTGLDLTQFFNDNEMGSLLEQLYGSREPTAAANDPNAEWVGMPEFKQEDLGPFRTIHVHFQNKADVRQFAELVNQSITDNTRYIWYPKVEDEDLTRYKAIENES